MWLVTKARPIDMRAGDDQRFSDPASDV